MSSKFDLPGTFVQLCTSTSFHIRSYHNKIGLYDQDGLCETGDSRVMLVSQFRYISKNSETIYFPP